MSNLSGDRQHFVPQAYLKRFTDTNKKDGLLYVYDLLRDKEFISAPAGVAHRNQYYRFTEDLYPDIDPDIVDKILDDNVPILDDLIGNIIETRKIPIPSSENIFESIYTQMGLMIARSPESRINSILLTEVAIKEFALTQLEDAPQEIKALVEEKGVYEAFKIDFNEDYFKQKTIELAASYTETLCRRTWQIVETPQDCHFITSDLPISVRKLTSYGAGSLADPNTVVFFPISKYIGLVGEFNSIESYQLLNREQVALLNTQTLERPLAQVFSCANDSI
ncbi:MAG: DUF4238 domain-containing protein [Bdellovibrionales bacterium]|nr:DUF4238 domain-containing protein [Bdellovibrionales bacterium]